MLSVRLNYLFTDDLLAHYDQVEWFAHNCPDWETPVQMESMP